MPSQHKPPISPVMALTIIRQILNGEGEYAAIEDLDEQCEGIREIVDQALAPAAVLQVPQVEIFRRIDPAKQAYLEMLVKVAIRHDYWIKEVAGESDVHAVSNMPEAMAAIFSEPLTTVTFETFASDENRQGPTFWVKCNTNDNEGFFEEWSPEAELFVKEALKLDLDACR